MSAAAAQASAPKKKSKLPLVAAAVLLLAGGAGGGWWWTQHRASAAQDAQGEAPAPARGPATYFALDPSFVVNLADTDMARYLQADVQLVTRDAATHTAIEAQAPALRNRLLLLFGTQTAAQLAQRSGKERLQEQGLAEVRKLLKEEGQPDKVDGVIFTSLVVQ